MQLEGEPIRMRLKADLTQHHSTTMTAAPITSAERFHLVGLWADH
jgi:hypothetical protein